MQIRVGIMRPEIRGYAVRIVLEAIIVLLRRKLRRAGDCEVLRRLGNNDIFHATF